MIKGFSHKVQSLQEGGYSESSRVILVIVMATLASIVPLAEAKKEDTRDHLVPVEEELGEGAVYQKLWQRKLLLTPGDVARFVHLPGNVGEEGAVSIYRDAGKKGAKPGGYWLTVTQPSGRLWNCISGPGVKRLVDPRTITVDRCDLPLPESVGLTVGKVWLAMLLQTRSEAKSESISLDSSTEIFSARNSDGVVLRAQFPRSPLKGHNAALFHIANLLIEHCNVPAAKRAAHARKIEEAASVLLMDVAKSTHAKRK